MHNLFEERVKLNAADHVYTHNDGRQFTSVSKVLDTIKEKFDENGQIAYATAKSRGVSKEEVQAEWAGKGKAATDHGTLVHEAIEVYQKIAYIAPENQHLKPMLLALGVLYKDYYQTHQEVTLYDEEYEIAGTSDTVCVTTRNKNSIIDISDFKTGGNGIAYESKYKKYLLSPMDYMADCNYNTYGLQLSCYAYMLEKLTGRKIGKLSIIYIPPTNSLAFKVIPVPYMKSAVIEIFNHFKSKKQIFKNTVTVQECFVEPFPNFG